MNETASRVIKIPAKPESVRQAELQRQLRAAAYCRVSTKEEDQANSYEVQKEYYTDKIMSNPAWTMAGVFADKGITGTSVKKREDFMRMIRHCRQKKIDVVLTKSVSRFARNTVDCLYYTRALKELGIAVIFEKENIHSLEEDSELRITLSGAFAQSESESISANVTWGKRRAMESGKATIQYKYLYGYRRGADDKPEIIPEEAEVVRWIYERYLAGASTRMLRDELHEQGVIYSEKAPQWTLPHIKSILRNEKYCGDVLMQKTFQQDVINRKVIKNTGQLPMYLIENHHEGIVSREKYNAVQAEMARRKAAKSPSKRASTGLAAYTSRYALSDRLVCGECGTLYRRCTWTRPDGKRVVWRCVSRLDYGKKYCHSSPTLDEAPLQQAIIAALNTVLPDLNGRIRQIAEALEAEIIPFLGSGMSLGDSRDDETLDWLERLPFTLAFVCGNHENYDALERYPVAEWRGGKVHRVRPPCAASDAWSDLRAGGLPLLHHGRCKSHDIEDGILEPDAPDFERRLTMLQRKPRARYRVNHISWWAQELPSDNEYAEARRSLDAAGWQMDHIITHCAPTSIALAGTRHNEADRLTDFLQEVRERTKYHYWLFGHYHDNKAIDEKHILLWEQIVQVI